MQDRIEKVIELAAPVSRVWRAVTDHEEFGQWFRVALDRPFEVGAVIRGQITAPGYEHIPWLSVVERIEPESLFAMSWPTYYDEDNPDPDYKGVPTTLCEFRLEEIPTGTRLTIVESGFASIPEPRHSQALRDNEGGWAEQVNNIKAHVEA